MRKGTWMLLFLLVLLAGCSAQAKGAETLPWPKEEVTLYVSSDLHWQPHDKTLSSALLPQMVYLEEIIDTLISEAEAGKPAALLLCGDLTNDGRGEEHRELSARLTEAEAAGVRIFVTPGNHDMSGETGPEEFMSIYAAFGYREAVSRDKDSISYLAEVNDGLWVLSLDCNVYGDKKSETAATISDSTLEWVEDCLQRAAASNAMVVPFSHHNLLPHTMDNQVRNYNIDQADQLAALLMDYGVPLYLSGHRHNSFVVETSRDGNLLTELVTDMPAAYPHRYTTICFQTDGTVHYEVPRLDVSAWAAENGRTEPELLGFADYTRALTEARMAQTAELLMDGLNVPQAEQVAMETYYLAFYQAYQERELWREGDGLRADPALALWERYAGSNVYGRWIPWVLRNQTNDQPVQTLGPFR